MIKKSISLLRHGNASEQQIVTLKLKKAGFAISHIYTHLNGDRSRYYRRIKQKPINAQGFAVGRYKVRSLMQALLLKAKRPKQHRYPVAGKPSVIAPNSLNRQFNPLQANTN